MGMVMTQEHIKVATATMDFSLTCLFEHEVWLIKQRNMISMKILHNEIQLYLNTGKIFHSKQGYDNVW